MVVFVVIFETICSVEEFSTYFTSRGTTLGVEFAVAERTEICRRVLNVLPGVRSRGGLEDCCVY